MIIPKPTQGTRANSPHQTRNRMAHTQLSRKLRIRFERRLDIHEALLKLAAVIICARCVDRQC